MSECYCIKDGDRFFTDLDELVEDLGDFEGTLTIEQFERGLVELRTQHVADDIGELVIEKFSDEAGCDEYDEPVFDPKKEKVQELQTAIEKVLKTWTAKHWRVWEPKEKTREFTIEIFSDGNWKERSGNE